MKKFIAAMAVAIGVMVAGLAVSAAPASAASRGNCAVIVMAMRAQGASPAVAQRFAQIAWRESGCSMQCVSDHDDLSCSRYGINFRFRGAARAWARLCGATSREDTKSLYVDTKCALAAYRTQGWRPWRMR